MRVTISIVGLGPGPLDQLTLGAWKALTGARHLILRTDRHPCVPELLAALPAETVVQSCDDLYETHAEFEQVYAAVVDRIFAATHQSEAIVYAVPGSPWVGEATTRQLVEQAAEYDATVEIIDGLSFVAPCFGAAGVDLMDGSQVIDAMLLARQHHPTVDVNLPLLVGQIYARWLASDVKLTLLNAYPAEHPVQVIRAAGGPNQSVITVPLAELDHEERFDHLAALYVPPLPANSSFTALQELVAHLRAPDGCPWDREQTLASLRKDLLDEAAEVLEAIDAETDGSDNSPHIAEELGDLLLVATMMTQIATKEGRFQMGDVIREVVTKLIRRHPHVFGDVDVTGVDNVLRNWDAIKAAEKAAKGLKPGPWDGIPAALPALEKALKVQSKAAKAGILDRSRTAHGEPALVRALGEVVDARRVGEVLWQLVALAHEHHIDAEDALRMYTVQYRRDHAAPAG
ncbi:MAG: MazG family protein [Caldilineaceae bacterium]|nr:MazG family protein [Caldilineaceae bacterium]